MSDVDTQELKTISAEAALTRVVASQRDGAFNRIAELEVFCAQLQAVNQELGKANEALRKQLADSKTEGESNGSAAPGT